METTKQTESIQTPPKIDWIGAAGFAAFVVGVGYLAGDHAPDHKLQNATCDMLKSDFTAAAKQFMNSGAYKRLNGQDLKISFETMDNDNGTTKFLLPKNCKLELTLGK